MKDKYDTYKITRLPLLVLFSQEAVYIYGVVDVQ